MQKSKSLKRRIYINYTHKTIHGCAKGYRILKVQVTDSVLGLCVHVCVDRVRGAGWGYDGVMIGVVNLPNGPGEKLGDESGET